MKIIHTSDVHLHSKHPERMEALKEILNTAWNNEVDVITIAGDLFDSHEEAEKLRAEVRQFFSNNPFKILVCPGNHDASAYKHNLDFGSDFQALGVNAIETSSFDDKFLFTGMPYYTYPTTDLMTTLKADENYVNILLLHCTLDIGFLKYFFGDNENVYYSYFPVTLPQLSRLGYDFFLAGHFHKEGLVKSLENNGRFIYPGSPVSITRSEQGRRQAYLIKIYDKGSYEINSITLKSFYFDKFEAFLLPENQKETLLELEEWLNIRGDAGELQVDLKGYIKEDEKKFRHQIDSVINERASVYHGWVTVEHILEDDLYKNFTVELENSDLEEDKKMEVRKRFLEAFSLATARDEEELK